MKQVIYSFLLTILLSITGTNVFAYDFSLENTDGITIYYNYINDGQELEVTCETFGYDNRRNYIGNVVIPEEVTFMNRTRKVKKIGAMAFTFCSGLTSVTIPNSVTFIGNWAFKSCSKLTSVTIPNSVTQIEAQAFSSCKSLTSIIIPNSLTVIEENMFDSCENLTTVLIPNSITKIGGGAFAGCKKLASVTIPNSVISIDASAFLDCSSLTSITIPSSVTKIGDEVFEGCNLPIVISEIENPFDIYDETFSKNTFQNATLYVPQGTKGKYKACKGWKKFFYIEEGIPSGVENVESNETKIVTRYTINGVKVTSNKKGIQIIQLDNGEIRKVIVK